MAKKKEAKAPEGAPAWMATYSDLVTLLMCFFVLLFAFSSIDAKKFQEVMNSFQGGAGPMEGGTSIVEDEYIFDGMPETFEDSAAGDQTYRAVLVKVDLDKIEEGETITATATNGLSKDPNDFEWQSSNPSVAEVDEEGNIKILKSEEVMIFAKDKETGVLGFCNINSENKNVEVPEIQNPSDWARVELEQALKDDLIPEILKNVDMQIEINRLEFAAVSVKIYEALSDKIAEESFDNPFMDTSDKEVLKAYALGITQGVAIDRFDPWAPLDREQAATMLTRVFKKVNFENWTLETDSEFELDYSGVRAFKDDADISSWAKPSVYFMVKNGIIDGVGDNMFAPKSFTSEESAMLYADMTREQAIVMGHRMVKNLKE